MVIDPAGIFGRIKRERLDVAGECDNFLSEQVKDLQRSIAGRTEHERNFRRGIERIRIVVIQSDCVGRDAERNFHRLMVFELSITVDLFETIQIFSYPHRCIGESIVLWCIRRSMSLNETNLLPIVHLRRRRIRPWQS